VYCVWIVFIINRTWWCLLWFWSSVWTKWFYQQSNEWICWYVGTCIKTFSSVCCLIDICDWRLFFIDCLTQMWRILDSTLTLCYQFLPVTAHIVALKPVIGKITRHYSRYCAKAFCFVYKCDQVLIYWLIVCLSPNGQFVPTEEGNWLMQLRMVNEI